MRGIFGGRKKEPHPEPVEGRTSACPSLLQVRAEKRHRRIPAILFVACGRACARSRPAAMSTAVASTRNLIGYGNETKELWRSPLLHRRDRLPPSFIGFLTE